jgi:excisionase family DNA binding protein
VQCWRVVIDGNTTELYSVREVADRLGVHPETIRRLIHDGRLEAVRVGRVLRVGGDELERFLRQQRVRPTRTPR